MYKSLEPRGHFALLARWLLNILLVQQGLCQPCQKAELSSFIRIYLGVIYPCVLLEALCILLEALSGAILELSHDGNGRVPNAVVMCPAGAAVLGRLKKLQKAKQFKYKLLNIQVSCWPERVDTMYLPSYIDIKRSYNVFFHFKDWNQIPRRGGVKENMK